MHTEPANGQEVREASEGDVGGTTTAVELLKLVNLFEELTLKVDKHAGVSSS